MMFQHEAEQWQATQEDMSKYVFSAFVFLFAIESSYSDPFSLLTVQPLCIVRDEEGMLVEEGGVVETICLVVKCRSLTSRCRLGISAIDVVKEVHHRRFCSSFHPDSV